MSADAPCPRPADALRAIRKLARRVFVKSLAGSSPYDADAAEKAAFKAGLVDLFPRQSVHHDKKLSDLTMAAYLMTDEWGPADRDKAASLGYDIAQSFFENRALSKPAVDSYDAMQRLWLLDALAMDERLPDDVDMPAIFATIRSDFERLVPSGRP